MPSFTQTERRASFGLASVFSLRMFGLFVILPVVALYADALRADLRDARVLPAHDTHCGREPSSQRRAKQVPPAPHL